MIQTALFFILGFLSAAFLALLVAPAIWRRAVAITRRRVEAALPLTMEEIQADKDRLRAEFAVAARQLEMSVKSLTDKTARQAIELGRDKEELARLAAELTEKADAIAKAGAQVDELQQELEQRNENVVKLTEETVRLESSLLEQIAQAESLGRMFDEASFSASSRQIEMVAKDSRLEKLADDLATARRERKEVEAQLRETRSEAKTAQAVLREEHKKNETFEQKVAQLTASLADSEDKLARRAQEMTRLREELKAKVMPDEGASDQIQRLEDRLTRITQENRKLRAALEEARPGTEAASDRDRDNALLRDRIRELAAEVVNLTGMLEGADSPVWKALADAPSGNAMTGEGNFPSLAERIRALRDMAVQKQD